MSIELLLIPLAKKGMCSRKNTHSFFFKSNRLFATTVFESGMAIRQ